MTKAPGAGHDIALHAAAPDKPGVGAPCNGCGLCCAIEPCPVGIVLFRRLRGACPALTWEEGGGRYVCGVLHEPSRFVLWLPAGWAKRLQPLLARWIAAGAGCDCSAVVENQVGIRSQP